MHGVLAFIGWLGMNEPHGCCITRKIAGWDGIFLHTGRRVKLGDADGDGEKLRLGVITWIYGRVRPGGEVIYGECFFKGLTYIAVGKIGIGGG